MRINDVVSDLEAADRRLDLRRCRKYLRVYVLY
jgi:hypothetical protein